VSEALAPTPHMRAPPHIGPPSAIHTIQMHDGLASGGQARARARDATERSVSNSSKKPYGANRNKGTAPSPGWGEPPASAVGAAARGCGTCRPGGRPTRRPIDKFLRVRRCPVAVRPEDGVSTPCSQQKKIRFRIDHVSKHQLLAYSIIE
jgi:hypothetical protein